MKNRSYGYDNLRFILIFCVVMAHFLEIFGDKSLLEAKETLYFVIYCFHMPVFVFLSGYFAKFTWKRLAQYVLLYAVFQTLYRLFVHYVLGYALVLQYHTPYWLLWYLLALIYYFVLLPLLERVPTKWGMPILFVSIIMSLLAGYERTIGYPYSLSRAIVFLPYFIIGHFVGRYKETVKKALTKNRLVWLWLGIAALIITVCMNLSKDVTKHMLYGSYSYAIGYDPLIRLVIFIVGLVWIAALLAFSLTLLDRKLPLISTIGQNTLPIFLLHGFAVKAVGKYGLLYDSAILLIIYTLAILLLFGNPWLGKLFSGKWKTKDKTKIG